MKKGSIDKLKFKIDSLCNTADPDFDDYDDEDMTLRFCKIEFFFQFNYTSNI